MNDNQIKSLIASGSANGTFVHKTNQPFRIGEFFLRRVGFAGIPSIVCTATHPEGVSMVPIVRQVLYSKLREKGLPYNHQAIRITPGVSKGRRKKFVDANENSPTFGKNKFGIEWEYRFEIEDIKTWENAAGRFPSGHYNKLECV